MCFVVLLVGEHLSPLAPGYVIGLAAINKLLFVAPLANNVFACMAAAPITIRRIASDEMDEFADREKFVFF